MIGGGKTYAQLSTEAIAQPTNVTLAAQVATVFKGETLRGLLLNAYAFGTMGTIAGIAAIAAFIAALVMLILSGLGLMHARRTDPGTEILTGRPAHGPHSVTTPVRDRPQRQPAARRRPHRHRTRHPRRRVPLTCRPAGTRSPAGRQLPQLRTAAPCAAAQGHVSGRKAICHAGARNYLEEK